MGKQTKFSGYLERLQKGMGRHVVFIPQAVVEHLGLEANTRLVGTVNGVKLSLASLSNADGTYYLSIGPHLRRDAKVRLGDKLTFNIKLDPRPEAVILPEELEEVLNTDPEAKAIFDTFTPGRQRSYAYYVGSAKRIDTRINRALDLAEKMRTGNLYGQGH